MENNNEYLICLDKIQNLINKKYRRALEPGPWTPDVFLQGSYWKNYEELLMKAFDYKSCGLSSYAYKIILVFFYMFYVSFIFILLMLDVLNTNIRIYP